jgi:hypothetical protein
MKKSKRNKKVISRENFPPTYPFTRLDPMAERMVHLLSFKDFIQESTAKTYRGSFSKKISPEKRNILNAKLKHKIANGEYRAVVGSGEMPHTLAMRGWKKSHPNWHYKEAWSPLIPSGPNAPKSQYSKLPSVPVKKPRETKLGTYGKAINKTSVDPVKVNLGMEAEKKRDAERNAARLKAAGGLGRLFTKEDTTLKTREDQYKSHQRKLDKETNRFLVRTGQDAEKMGLSKKGVRKVLTKFSQERDMENHDAPKSDSPRVNRIHKWGRKTASKANAFRAQHHDQVKKMLKVPGYGQQAEGFNLKAKHKNPKGGLNAAGRSAYNKATGSNLKPPAPHPKTKKDAGRRKSFCARMSGMKKRLTSAKTARDPDSRINKSLRAWNC